MNCERSGELILQELSVPDLDIQLVLLNPVCDSALNLAVIQLSSGCSDPSMRIARKVPA